MSFLGLTPEKPKEVSTGKEQAKLARERQALLARSSFDANTRLTGAGGLNSPASTHRSSLGG